MWRIIYWSVLHFDVTNIKSTNDVEKWKKRHFLQFKTAYQSSLMCQVKESESILHFLNSFEGQESCETWWKFGAMCNHIRKNAEAS